MTDMPHTIDPRIEIEDTSGISCFVSLETSPIVRPSRRSESDCGYRGMERFSFLHNNGDAPLEPGVLFDDPFEHSTPSTPSRTPPKDEKEQHPCLKPGCNKIFTHLHKLQRHYRDAHGKPQYDCPFPDCLRKGAKGFARKDNMRQHHRLVHNKHLDPGEIPRRKRGASA